jgi:hypothetical protein
LDTGFGLRIFLGTRDNTSMPGETGDIPVPAAGNRHAGNDSRTDG